MSGARILVVEDEWVIADDIRQCLSNSGFELAGLTDTGEQAVALAERERPDLVMMDIMLAGAMDGIEAAAIIRERFAIPVIYLTAYADEAILERAKRTEPAGYMVKPFEERELRSTVEVALYRADAERRLLEGERFMRDITAALGEGVVGIDAEGRISFLNPEAVRLLGGVGRVGESWRPIVGEAAEDHPIALTLADGEPRRVEEGGFRHSERGAFPVAYVVSPLEAGGVVVAFQDITERKRMIDELAAARRAAEAASRAKSEFLALVGHEIRTPMNAIIGMAGLLEMSGLDARQGGYVTTQKEAGRRLVELIDDILALATTEIDESAPHAEGFSPVALIDALRPLIEPGAREKGLTLRFQVAPAVPPRLFGDQRRLCQLLLHLLNNAVKFTERGEVGLRVIPGDEAEVLFQVHDSGIGIPSDDQARIFEPFSQADASATRQYGGSGLGLAIAHRLAQAVGGRLWVESEVGRGSRFNLSLPLGALDEEAAPEVTGVPDGR